MRFYLFFHFLFRRHLDLKFHRYQHRNRFETHFINTGANLTYLWLNRGFFGLTLYSGSNPALLLDNRHNRHNRHRG